MQPKTLRRRAARARLDTALRTPTLVAAVRPDARGVYTAITVGWDAYWEPLASEHKGAWHPLEALRSSWESYITSGFDRRLRREYCFRYFDLLRIALSERVDQAALSAVLGFEVFTIGQVRSGTAPLAATVALRNPAFLLSFLRYPRRPTSVKCLPLVMPHDRAHNSYYSYRQYKSPTSDVSMIVYLPTDPRARTTGFREFRRVASALGSRNDPWSGERAARIVSRVVAPIVGSRASRSDHPVFLRFVDLGGGTGSLVSSMSAALDRWFRQRGPPVQIRHTLIDVAPQVPTARNSRRPRYHLDSREIYRSHFEQWRSRGTPTTRQGDVCIGVLAELLDNVSWIGTETFTTRELGLAGDTLSRSDPATCLSPNGDGPASLRLATRRRRARGRTVLPHPSLHSYFGGLALLQGASHAADGTEIVVPTRHVVPERLRTTTGHSVFETWLRECDWLIVEDYDLGPEDVVQHLSKFHSARIEVFDVSSKLRQAEARVYVMRRPSPDPPPFGGRHIW